MSEQPPEGPPEQPADGGRWLQDPSGQWQFIPDQHPSGPAGPPPPPAMYGPPAPKHRTWLRRHPYWSVGIVFVVLAAAGTGGGVASTSSSSSQTATGNVSNAVATFSPEPTASNFPSTLPSPTPSPSDTTPALAIKNVGDAMTLTSTDGGNLVATITVNSVTIHTGPGGQYNESPTKGEYAVADVTVTVDSGSYDYSEDDFAFQEPDGTTYSMDDGNGLDSGYDPSLDFGTLPAGGSKRGNVVFDVSKVHGGQITLVDGFAGSELGYWKVP